MNLEPNFRKIPLRSRRAFAKVLAACVASLWFKRIKANVVNPVTGRAKYINPLIGASTSQSLGEGKTFPGPTTPFGMVQLGPDTITDGDNAPGYSYDQSSIEGFSFMRMSGVGWYGDFGNLQTMATTGPMKFDSGRASFSADGWRSPYQHSTERAEANYYAVSLDRYGIRAEATAAPHSGMLKFTFPKTDAARIQLNLPRRIGGTSTRQYFRVIGDRAVEGWMRCPQAGGGWGNGDGKVNYTVYFHAEFSQPFKQFGAWQIAIPDGTFPLQHALNTSYFNSEEYLQLVRQAKIVESCRELEGNHIGFFAEFASEAKDTKIGMRAGISFVSMDGARENLRHEISDWDFNRVRERGAKLWEKALGTVEIEGASEDEKAIFNTALYHTMIDPRSMSDVDGNYIAGDGKVAKASSYTPRTIFSGWDVFRGAFPLMTLLNPSMISDEINSLVELATTSGKGYLERWEIMNAYSGCMDGDPATSVILDAYVKGIRSFDVEKAYAACRQTAAGVGSQTNRPNNEFYMKSGFVPEQVSWTLDNCYFDWCVGQFAKELGKLDDAATFLTRSQNYKKIFDRQVGSMHAKDSSGNWTPWKGLTTFGQGCTESNPGQQTWFVPHDVPGLIRLMGGAEQFSSQLEAFFNKTPSSFGWNDYYNHANEPVHHIVYLFVYAGKPWLTQKWVRQILTNAYRNNVNGICGNDDVGQMSAWYVLGALGFYPVCPGSGIYILGSPLFRKVTIHLDKQHYGGATFEIMASNQKRDHPYIQSALLNGKPLNRAWLRHSEIAKGGRLEVEMGPEPNKNWASSADQMPQCCEN